MAELSGTTWFAFMFPFNKIAQMNSSLAGLAYQSRQGPFNLLLRKSPDLQACCTVHKLPGDPSEHIRVRFEGLEQLLVDACPEGGGVDEAGEY